MSKETNRFTALLVCKANECRSVYAADLIRPFAEADGWGVLSAGTGAFPDSPQCVDAVTTRSHTHSSKQLDSALINQASVILTMERSHRARVAEISPAARSKTFTMPEAVQLAKFVLESISNPDSEFGDSRGEAFNKLSGTQKLMWLVAEMNEARGFINPILDEILDAHGADAISHELAFTQIEKQATELIHAFTEVLHGLSQPEGHDK